MKHVIEAMEKAVEELKKLTSVQPVKESGRFKKLADGWVLDKALNVDWGPSSSKEMDFEDAIEYCQKLGARLPTVRELFSLVDRSRHDPAIDTSFFKDTKSAWYWTSEPTDWNKNIAWCVGFGYGYVSNDDKDSDNYVRPVRPSQCLIV